MSVFPSQARSPGDRAWVNVYNIRDESVQQKVSSMNAVEIRQVTKTYGAFRAVSDLSLDVPEGTVYGFIGPNGSGKTTTMRMIVGIFHPDQGTAHVFGKPMLGD